MLYIFDIYRVLRLKRYIIFTERAFHLQVLLYAIVLLVGQATDVKMKSMNVGVVLV